MANLKAIRKRIVSAKNTQKITKAMKLVSAAKLRRAQEQVLAQRPYARHLGEVVRDLAGRADPSAHPLLVSREAKSVELLVLTADRGLCGGFNANINRQIDRMLVGEFAAFGASPGSSLGLAVVGKKGRDYHARRRRNLLHEYTGIQSAEAPARAAEIARRVISDFTEGKVDAVHLVYNEFKSAISQRVVVHQLLPLQVGGPALHAVGDASPAGEYLYEPSKEALLGTLLPMYVETMILRALLESIASEHGARMSAMDSATTNAREMIASLTLQFNRARQAAITKELMEIIGGAEALKG